MKVIYFDCEGVVVRAGKVDTACVARLASLAKATGYKLVCFTDAKKSKAGDIEKALVQRGITDSAILLNGSDIGMEGMLNQYTLNKGVSNYIVLSAEELGTLNTYTVNRFDLLTDKDVKKLKRLLN